ncbi:hypothetical protein F2981_32685 (plasmid) [Sinorhizobium meliloti]|nr:hypothetical protein [Sinorhizobium meliloti]
MWKWGDRCSSDRDAFHPIELSPCSIQGNRFERRMRIFYSRQKRNQAPVGKSGKRTEPMGNPKKNSD